MNIFCGMTSQRIYDGEKIFAMPIVEYRFLMGDNFLFKNKNKEVEHKPLFKNGLFVNGENENWRFLLERSYASKDEEDLLFVKIEPFICKNEEYGFVLSEDEEDLTYNLNNLIVLQNILKENLVEIEENTFFDKKSKENHLFLTNSTIDRKNFQKYWEIFCEEVYNGNIFIPNSFKNDCTSQVGLFLVKKDIVDHQYVLCLNAKEKFDKKAHSIEDIRLINLIDFSDIKDNFSKFNKPLSNHYCLIQKMVKEYDISISPYKLKSETDDFKENLENLFYETTLLNLLNYNVSNKNKKPLKALKSLKTLKPLKYLYLPNMFEFIYIVLFKNLKLDIKEIKNNFDLSDKNEKAFVNFLEDIYKNCSSMNLENYNIIQLKLFLFYFMDILDSCFYKEKNENIFLSNNFLKSFKYYYLFKD